MTKPLNQLLEKLNPDVIKAAEQRAEIEIKQLKTSILREQTEPSQVATPRPSDTDR